MADVVVDQQSTDAKVLIGQGIKAYILEDYDASVQALSRAIEVRVEELQGDALHESLGEVYLYYGKALLGVTRSQNEAIAEDAVPKDQEESDEEDEGIETEEVENTENEKNEQNEQNVNNENTGEEKDESKSEVDAEKTKNGEKMDTDEVAKTNGEATVTNGGAGPSSSKADEPDSTEDSSQDDEADDLQIAWEVLELAKKIYEKQGECSSLAETLIALGEVSLENENFEAAIKDIKEGLRIQTALFTNDNRTVAETYYKLGVVYSTDSQMNEAIDSFEKSLEYLRNKIASLEKIDPPTDESKEQIEEIKRLIPDIQEKIDDMKSSKEEAIKKLTEAFIAPKRSDADGAGPSSASSAKPASDISHLVKRKRKSDENDIKDDVPNKKAAKDSDK